MAGKPRTNHELVKETWLFYVNSIQVFYAVAWCSDHTSLTNGLLVERQIAKQKQRRENEELPED
jgi:hypothetical protein